MLRRELGSRGADDLVEIRSAGIAPYARDGALVSLDTRMTLREVGIDIGDEATSTDLKRHPELLGGGRPGDRDDRAAGARPRRALSDR